VLSAAFLLDLAGNTVQPLNLQMTPQYLDDGKSTTMFQDMFYSRAARDGLSTTQQMNNSMFFLGKTDTAGMEVLVSSKFVLAGMISRDVTCMQLLLCVVLLVGGGKQYLTWPAGAYPALHILFFQPAVWNSGLPTKHMESFWFCLLVCTVYPACELQQQWPTPCTQRLPRPTAVTATLVVHAGAAADLSEIQILSLDKRKEAYFCKPVDASKPNQCKVVSLSYTGALPWSRSGYAAASTVHTFKRTPTETPAVTTLMFLYGGEYTTKASTEPYHNAEVVDTSEAAPSDAL
jgi:hypothetical protein